MLDLDQALEAQLGGGLAEGDQRDRVREHVVDPAHLARRAEDQLRIQHPQIVAVARPEHRAVLVERHRPPVAIDRGVADAEPLRHVSGDGRRARRPTRR